MSAAASAQPSPNYLRSHISRAVSDSLIQEQDPELQPLARRQNTPVANRERFQQNQRTAAHGLVQRSGWFILVAMILFAILAFVWIDYYFTGWYIWRKHGNKDCDERLADWLLVTLLLPLIWLVVECFSCRRVRVLVKLLELLALLIGLQMFYQSKTCDTTNPELYKFVQQYLIVLTIVWVSFIVMPVFFVAIVIYGMMHGWFDEINGASPDTIKQVETVKYDPDLFNKEGESEAGLAPAECCVCTEVFDSQREIKRTKCQHYFHEECLGKWLRVSTTCPLCRNDIERATLGENAPGAPSSCPDRGPNMFPFADEMTATTHERGEVRTLLCMFPGLDEQTALDAVRNSGSAERAAEALNSFA
jgi:hypothetical protein